MRLEKALIFALLSLFSASLCFCQDHNGKSNYTRTRYSKTATKVPRSKAKLLCPIFESRKYPHHGFGLKLGDPFAFTYKLYYNKHFSIAADIGKASSGLYTRYFKDKFEEYGRPDSLQGAQLEYFTHKVKSDWMGEVKFLYAINGKKISPGFQAYTGLGLQAKSTQLQYTYLDTNDETGTLQQHRFTYGAVAVLGIEYAYFQLPISAFMELELYTDLLRDPGYQRFQGGVGLRYVF